MCDILAGTADSPTILRLCGPVDGNPVDCIIDHYLEPIILRPSRPSVGGNEPTQVAPRQVIAQLCAVSSHVIAEERYFDVDYRSEYAATAATRFDLQTGTSTRLHFVSVVEPPSGDLYSYARAVRDQGTHNGYIVVRPQRFGTVGRSVVSLPLTLPSNRIKVRVQEHIQLFGVNLSVYGIPFMEQDGQMIRCAHVSIWICHYVSYLRGRSARYTTGRIHELGSVSPWTPRKSPTTGLTLEAVYRVLQDVGFQPEIISGVRLSQPQRRMNWSDRSDMVQTAKELDAERLHASQALQALQDLPDPTEFAEQRDRTAAERRLSDAMAAQSAFWIREQMTAALCRYLNSGIPAILLHSQRAHTQVAVGYLRNRDRPLEKRVGASTAAVTAVVVADDLAGAFTIVEVEELAREALKSGLTIAVPLPRSVNVSGGAAERFAMSWLDRMALPEGGEFSELSSLVASVKAASRLDGRDVLESTYTIRTYVTSSARFKDEIPSRVLDSPEAVRLLCEMQLPKYIWVSEIVDRVAHGKDDPKCVVGFIAIDATMPEIDTISPLPYDVVPLATWLPGGLSSLRPGESPSPTWCKCSTEMIIAGIWNSALQPDEHSSIDRYETKLADPQ